MKRLTVAHVSTFPPTQCGIATYAQALAAQLSNWQSIEVPIVFSAPDTPTNEFVLNLDGGVSSAAAHLALASTLNRAACDVVSLQHEFGIFGGVDGKHVLDLVAALRKPVVTTLHTVSLDLAPSRLPILRQLAELSTSVIVLSPEDARILEAIAPAAAAKITVIRHGVPEVAFTFPDECASRGALRAQTVFVSSGHVRPTKGYHLALQALAQFKDVQPNFLYLILGCVQPQYTYGAQYGEELQRLIRALGLTAHVRWRNEYLPWPTLIEEIKAADVGLVTYTDRGQASSGVLPLMLALGRPVVATRFAYAERLAAHIDSICLAGWNDPRQIFNTLMRTVTDIHALRRLMRRSYECMRPYVWSRVGAEYDLVMRKSLRASTMVV